jgi:hypothetical protein
VIIDNHIFINNEESQSDSKDSSYNKINDGSNKNDFGSNKNDFGSNKNDFSSNKNDKLANVDTYNIIENHNINIDDIEDQGVSTNRFPPERTNSKVSFHHLCGYFSLLMPYWL